MPDTPFRLVYDSRDPDAPPVREDLTPVEIARAQAAVAAESARKQAAEARSKDILETGDPRIGALARWVAGELGIPVARMQQEIRALLNGP